MITCFVILIILKPCKLLLCFSTDTICQLRCLTASVNLCTSVGLCATLRFKWRVHRAERTLQFYWCDTCAQHGDPCTTCTPRQSTPSARIQRKSVSEIMWWTCSDGDTLLPCMSVVKRLTDPLQGFVNICKVVMRHLWGTYNLYNIFFLQYQGNSSFPTCVTLLVNRNVRFKGQRSLEYRREKVQKANKQGRWGCQEEWGVAYIIILGIHKAV